MIKRRIFIGAAGAMVVLAGMMAMTGCKEEPVPEVDFLKCKIEGVAWEANKSLSANMDQGILILNGVNAANDTLRFLMQDHQPGTWPVKNIQNIIVYLKNGKTYVPLNSADAALTITSHDAAAKVVKGTFYYTADDGAGNWLVITGGEFRCTYP
ncbi:MAG TPA: DUF6252 family protein [Bacteroidales bacterium]|nr:DUF6252 family protein [Bacteroidales bacterium]HRZ48457.1 DUF6252 family protein [Bacteroidales bacterium]